MPGSPHDLGRVLAVARGDEPADCVVTGGRVFSVFTREWLTADVAIVDGRIAGLGSYSGRETVDATGRFVVPGFIDAHMHFETTRLLPHEFARLVVPQGTTAVVADPHEIANVLGVPGVRWFADLCRDLPLDAFFMASSSVPASPFESASSPFGMDDLRALLERDDFLGLAEMMNFPGIIRGDDDELAKLRVAGALPIDGHAPGVLGKDLNAYASTGIHSDHEAITLEEGRERLRAGMWLLIREASTARNLDALVPLLLENGPSRIAFCSDDREPDDLADRHIGCMVRRAVAAGVPAEDALVSATLSAATCHGLTGLGAIAPGYQADLLLLPDLESFRPETVLKRGKPATEMPEPDVPDWVRDTIHIHSAAPGDLAVEATGAEIRVIGLVPDQIVTSSLVDTPTLVDGLAVADPDRDLAKIAVIERHHATGRVGRGFVRGSGLQRGALASTVAHDAHNIVVIGVSDEDMLAAVAAIAEMRGGLAVVDAGQVVAASPLPIAGLISDQPSETVIAESRACSEAAAALGWHGYGPFMTLSFLALSVIPALKITDQGLVDVARATLVPLEA